MQQFARHIRYIYENKNDCPHVLLVRIETSNKDILIVKTKQLCRTSTEYLEDKMAKWTFPKPGFKTAVGYNLHLHGNRHADRGITSLPEKRAMLHQEKRPKKGTGCVAERAINQII